MKKFYLQRGNTHVADSAVPTYEKMTAVMAGRGLYCMTWTLHHTYNVVFATYIHSFFPLACAEFDDSLPFSGASSLRLCYVLFPATLPHQLFFHPLSPHLAIYFLVYLSILLFPNSYIILFWVAGSIPDGVIGIFQWHNPSGRNMALGSTQPLTEVSTRCISWG